MRTAPPHETAHAARLSVESTSEVLERILAEDLGQDAVQAMVDQTALREVDDEAQAESSYRAAISSDANLVSAHTALAALLCRQGRQEEALDIANAALESCDNNARLHHVRGCILESAGRLAAAMEAFGRAIRLDSSLAEPHYRLGVLCERLGDPVTSARHLEAYERRVSALRFDSRLN